MRYKFRGKTKDGEWVYGSLVSNRNDGKVLIATKGSLFMTDVLPESVGQFTGLTDRDGKEIYEGDVIQDKQGDRGTVIFFNGGYVINLNPDDRVDLLYLDAPQILGNTTDGISDARGQGK